MSAALVIRTARLLSGLLLSAFVAGHLLSLAAGLISLDALSTAAFVLMGPWANPVGGPLLILAAFVHLVLGLHAIAVRRSAALRRSDAVQIALGLAIVPLLTPHILTVGVARIFAPDLDIGFRTLLAFYWQRAPAYAIQQLTVVVIIWTHASIGLHGWMSLKSWWPRAGGFVTPLLFAVPILSLLGFVEAGKAVLALLETDPAFAAEVARRWDRLQSIQPDLMPIRDAVSTVYIVAVGTVLAVLALRLFANRNALVSVAYGDGVVGRARQGLSILDVSRLSNVPHASVCSGRGRCGTCRVRVIAGAGALTPMDEVERWTLGAGPGEKTVRLACRARVLDDGLFVERLLPPDADASAARRPQDWLASAQDGSVDSASEQTNEPGKVAAEARA